MDDEQEKPFGTIHYVVVFLLLIPDIFLKILAWLGAVTIILPAISEIYSAAVAGIIGFWFVMKLGFAQVGGLRLVVGGVLNLLGIPGSFTVGTLLSMRFANHPKEAAVAGKLTGKAGAAKAEGAALKGAATAGKTAEKAEGAAAKTGGAAAKTGAKEGAITTEEVSPPPMETGVIPPKEEVAEAAPGKAPEAKPSEIPKEEAETAENEKEMAKALGEKEEPAEELKGKLLEMMPEAEKRQRKEEDENYQEAA